ncbi:glycosyltransferase family 4 protein [Arthrobacter sp. ATA002]|uniref:glycosyltransferase family 4 protein n=1 Tax=Arthrobacter sp. ATA002 TaxID=2991715 RepID=UPI0022A69D6B|nr:glycosyltransferase family 4 protein [Arthrobacter sp. ATA002]WAP53327.1 glycosyltransferase family 4 protein [Arthrobacter sp. ATA002]
MRVFEGWTPVLDAVPYTPTPRTVLHFLTNSLPYTASGYAQRSHSLLRAQSRAGWAVHAVTRQGYPALVGKLTGRETENIDGVHYHRLFVARLPSGMDQRLQEQTAALLKLCLRLRPEVLHTTTHFVNALVVSTVARALGIPWVYEVRGLLAETWASSRPGSARHSERHRNFRRRESDATRCADAVITLGEAMKASITEEGGCAPDKVELIPNAVGGMFLDTPRSPAEARMDVGLDPDTLTIGTVSSLVGYEGLDDLIRAFALLSPEIPNLRCLIVGDGADSSRLRNLARELGVSDSVSFPGRVDSAQSHLYHQALDIFVLPRKNLAVTRTVTP